MNTISYMKQNASSRLASMADEGVIDYRVVDELDELISTRIDNAHLVGDYTGSQRQAAARFSAVDTACIGVMSFTGGFIFALAFMYFTECALFDILV